MAFCVTFLWLRYLDNSLGNPISVTVNLLDCHSNVLWQFRDTLFEGEGHRFGINILHCREHSSTIWDCIQYGQDNLNTVIHMQVTKKSGISELIWYLFKVHYQVSIIPGANVIKTFSMVILYHSVVILCYRAILHWWLPQNGSKLPRWFLQYCFWIKQYPILWEFTPSI